MNRILKLNFFISIFLSISTTSLLSMSHPSWCFAEVGKKEFESIEKVSQYILSRYPREEYTYIGLGRSPVPVMAYLQSEENTLIRNLPLTDFKYPDEELSLQQKKRLFQHFDQFLPLQTELRGRTKLIIIDLVIGGYTLFSAHHYLTDYLQNYRPLDPQNEGLPPLSLAGFGIIMEGCFQRIKPKYKAALDLFPLKGNHDTLHDPEEQDHLIMMMAAKLYKDVAEYEAFDIEAPRPPESYKPRPDYQAFVTEIRDAKSRYRAGLLNDAWTNQVFDVLAHPDASEEHQKFMTLLRQINTGRLPDAESTREAKAIILGLVRSLISPPNAK